jgi:hypothetical protein
LELRFTGADACRRAGLSDLLHLSRGIDASALLKRQTKLAIVDVARFERAIERIARLYFPGTKSRHPTVWMDFTNVQLTLGLLRTKMREMLARSLGIAPVDDIRLSSIRSQNIWDSHHRVLRSALVDVPWQEVTPCPVWHAWR